MIPTADACRFCGFTGDAAEAKKHLFDAHLCAAFLRARLDALTAPEPIVAAEPDPPAAGFSPDSPPDEPPDEPGSSAPLPPIHQPFRGRRSHTADESTS